MTNETEVQGGSPNLAEVVKYIAEREDNLSKYSDKLRKNVEAIFNIFGNKRYCQVCNKENNPGNNYVPDEKQAIIHAEITGHSFVPKINVSIEFKGTPFNTFTLGDGNDEHPDYVKEYLSMEDGELYIVRDTYTCADEMYEHRRMFAYEPSRDLIKRLVNSGAITQFFNQLAEKLIEVGDNYKEVAEKAERMAQAISS